MCKKTGVIKEQGSDVGGTTLIIVAISEDRFSWKK